MQTRSQIADFNKLSENGHSKQAIAQQKKDHLQMACTIVVATFLDIPLA